MSQTPDPEVVEAVETVLDAHPEDVEAYRNGDKMKKLLLGMEVDNVLPNHWEHHPEVVSEELERQLNQDDA